MKQFLLAILATLFLISPVASATWPTYPLLDLLNDREARFFENVFYDLDLDEIKVMIVPVDGPGDTVAFVDPHADRPSNIIYLDWFDWSPVPYFGPDMCQKNKIITEVFIHELIHIRQTHRGQDVRDNMQEVFAREVPYMQRWFEIEAYAVSRMYVRLFPFFEGAWDGSE